MIKKYCITSLLVFFVIAIKLNVSYAADGAGVYGGGPFYKNRNYVIDELKQSGFKWVCVWTIHMESNGDLGFNGEFNLVQNGTYIGNSTYPNFPADMTALKTAPTTIEWIEFGLSGWGSGTFDHIKTYVNSEGTGPNSTLYKNFKALYDAIPAIDAISFDDESTYDEPSTTAFAIMLADIGFKVSVCPYTSVSHWQNVVANTNSARPGAIEDVHIQCYAGGSGNNPCTWEGYFASEINVMPGVEDGGSIGSQMASWNNQCGIIGGWLWLYDDFDGNSSLVQQYASAITNNITQVSSNPPGQASNPNPASGATDVNTQTSLTWTAGSNTTSHKVYFGTSNPPELQSTVSTASYNPGSLNTNTTYYWQVDEVNSVGTTTGSVWSFTTTSNSVVDHTDPVGTGAITCRAQINTNEGAAKAFDNLYTSGSQNSDWSKWLDNGGTPSSSNPSWIQIQLPNAVVVNSLSIVSANDDFGRDPEDFKLRASNDGLNWTNIGSWTGETWSNRFQKRDFSVSNSASYAYYRLEITKNDENVSMTQFCEIMLYGPTGSSSIPVASFTADNTNISTGNSVSFTDQSINSPTFWSWTFEGGSPATSTDQNPTVAYSSVGNYDVTLTVTNADGSDSETKTGYITVTDNVISYCESQGDNTSYEWISEVQIGSFTKTSSASGYANYTSETVTLGTGSTSVQLTPGFKNGSYSEYWLIWIDLNVDGDFDDADELVFSPSSSSSTVSGNLSIPANAAGVTTRMRIAMKYGGAPSSCGSFTYGEVEDYTVSIAQAPAIFMNVDEMKKETNVNCYPNPFSNKVTLLSETEIVRVFICGVDGKIIKVLNFNEKNVELNTLNYDKGIYLITIENNKGSFSTHRLIKQ